MKYELYVITDQALLAGRECSWVVREALEGGATVIQYREKANLPTRILSERAQVIREITLQFQAGFIVNDRIDIALAVQADGVHLGENDLPIPEARRIAPHLLIGSSCSTVDEARRAAHLGADYLGVGPVYPTATKLDAGESIGLVRLREIKQAVNIPVVAIGGISLERVALVLATGVDGVAVVSAVIGHTSPRTQAVAFRKIIAGMRSRHHA